MAISHKNLHKALHSGNTAVVTKALSDRVRTGVLNLSSMDLTQVPPEIFSLSKPVVHLNLSGNQLTTLPDQFEKLPRLQILNLHNNQLKELPASMGSLPALTSIELGKNKFKSLPPVLLEIPTVTTLIGIPKFARGQARKNLEFFFRHSTSVSVEIRACLFALLSKNTKAIAALTLSELASCLRGELPSIHAAATAELLSRSANVELQSGAGHSITVLGNVAFKKSELKSSVKAREIDYSPKVTNNTTHIVLGKSPKNTEAIVGLSYTFLTPQQAASMITHQVSKTKETKPLQQDSVHRVAHAENISLMLMSKEDGTIEMGLQLVKTLGFPPEASTALFVVAKLSPNAKHRGAARKLIKAHGSKGLREVLADRGKLAFEGDKAEKNTASKLQYYARKAGDVDWLEVARMVHQKTGYGLSYILDTAPVEQRVALLRDYVQKNALNFHAVYSPGYRPGYTNPFAYEYYQGRTVPDYIFELTELESLSISYERLNKLSPNLVQMTHLKTLDLSWNMFTALPDYLGELSQLTTLHLDGNEFPTFPSAVIKRLTNLRTLTIQGNRNASEYAGIQVPQDVREALPGCTFRDGLTHYQQRGY